MIRKLLQTFLLRYRFWRRIGFDELSELYTSSMLRNLALSLVGLFVPIYLYKLGFSIPDIFLFLATAALIRLVADPLAGIVVGRIGPKHAIMQSYVLQILALFLLLTMPQFLWPLPVVGAAWGISMSLFFLAYHTDFSAIRHTERSGKELSYLNILERIGGVLGPLIGGVVATFIGAEYTIGATILFFMVAMLPLLLSSEPIPKQQNLDYHIVPFKEIRHYLFAHIAFGIDGMVSMTLWPLYVAIFIFVENTYAAVGIVMSISFAIAILAIYAMGKVVDRKKGGLLLQLGTIVNAIIHFLRPFASGFQGVLAVNIANDSVNPAYRMPYLKGWYDTITKNPQSRIAHIVSVEVIGQLTKGAFWLCLWLTTATFDPQMTMIVAFVATGFISLGIMTHRFAALRS